MAKFKLSNDTFGPIEQGIHVFKIVAAEYDETFGRIEIKMQTKNGRYHTERFYTTTNAGEVNPKAIAAFSYFAKTALNNFKAEEIELDELLNKFIKCEVKHVESTAINPKTDKPYINVQLGNKYTAESFESSDLVDIDLI